MNMPEEFMPTANVEAEQSLLGCLLLDNRALDDVADVVRPGDLYHENHRLILQAIIDLVAGGKTADIITVLEALERAGQAERVGGLAYLGELANNTPSVARAKHYATIVRERATLRELQAACADIHTMTVATDGGTTAERVIAAADRIAQVVESGIRTKTGPVLIGNALTSLCAHMQDVIDGKEYRAHKVGLIDLDEKLFDLVPGALVIVAGRPGMGKSALALKAAYNVANDNQPGAVAVFTMEMPEKQVAARVMAVDTKLPLAKILDPRGFTDEEWTRFSASMGRVNELPLYIDETPAQSLQGIRARCNVIRRKAGAVKLVVVDYLQLMATDTRSKDENRASALGSITRGLKTLAKELGCPVLCLSSLNRGCESRPNKRPMMSDLRESGDIESDADLVAMCYRDEVYNPDSQDIGVAEILIRKQRNGPTDEVRVAWLGEIASFADLDYQAYAARVEELRKPKQQKGFQ
jgi:replicative DNA helicase